MNTWIRRLIVYFLLYFFMSLTGTQQLQFIYLACHTCNRTCRSCVYLCIYMCVCIVCRKCYSIQYGKRESLSHSVMSNSATSWTVALQASLSMGFSWHKCWSGLPFPSPGDLPDPGIEPKSKWILYSLSYQGSPIQYNFIQYMLYILYTVYNTHILCDTAYIVYNI